MKHWAFLLAVLAWAALGLAQEAFTVGKLEIVGNAHVPTKDILTTVGFGVGDVVTADRVREAAKKIENLGYFAKVTPELTLEDGKVVVRYKVVEYPLIEKVTILGIPPEPRGSGTLWSWIQALLGPPRITEKTVRSILEEHNIRPGHVLNRFKLEDALKKVLDEYRKKDLATVQIGQIIPQEELVIEIQELPVLGHRFTGLVTVPEAVVQAFITVPSGKLGRLSQIQESLQNLTNSVYFSHVNVIPELGEGGVWLNWEVRERSILPEPTEVSAIELVGIEALPRERITSRVGPLPQGKVTNYDILRALSWVNDYYRREGYFMVDFASEGVQDGVLRVRVREGRIATIHIEGNTRTKEEVIRRTMKLSPGDFLTVAAYTAAQQGLMALGYFRSVTIEPAWESDGVELLVRVQEQDKLGSIRGSMSYSPKDQGFVGNLEYAQKNLWGTAQDLSISFSRGIALTGATTWNFGYRARAVPVYDLVGLDLYRKETKDEGTTVIVGGSVTLAYPLARYLNLTLTLTGEREPEGSAIDPRTSLAIGLAYSDRDNPFFPRWGHHGSLTLEKAGTFAPGAEYLSLRGQLARYWPLDFETQIWQGRGAFAQRALFAWGWDIPSRYLFDLGGVDSVRGAKLVRTDRMVLINSELRFELAQGLSLALFWDLGASLAAPVVKSSVGIEFGAYIAGMYVRIDMAWPTDRPFSWVPVFEFAMSPMF